MANQQSGIKVEQTTGPGCVRLPSRGQRELVRLSEKARVVETHVQTSPGPVQLAAGQLRPFCAYAFPSDKEGIVTGVSFYEESGDYFTNPVFFGKVGVDQVGQLLAGKLPAGTSLKSEVIDTYQVTFGPRGSLLRFPGDRGYYFGRGRAPALSMRNGTGAPIFVEGYMTLLVWAEEDRTQALRQIGIYDADQAPFGGEELFKK